MAFIPNSGSVAAWLQSDNASVITVGSGSVFAIVQNLQGASVSGTVIANQGTNPWVITGSVQASLTPAANQSVSGTVGASIIGLTPVAVTNTPSISGTVNVGNTVTINSPSVYGNISGSVVAFINNTPAVSVQGTVFVSGSVITVGTAVPNQSISGTVQAQVQGSVATVIIGGSIAASFTPPANQSVSGTVQTDVRGSIAAVIIGGSIAANFTPPANQSVSGAVSVSNFPLTQNVSGSVVATQGTTPWTVTSSIAGGIFPISGSVAATIVGTPNVNVAGSVVAFQGAGWSGSVAAWLQSSNASVITVGTAAPNQSVSGTVGASIIGLPPVNVTNFPTTQNVSGSVVAFVTGTPAVSVQGTVFVSGSVITVGGSGPANQSVSGTVQTQVQASVAVVIIGGSIAASFTPPANQSVSGVVMAQGLNAPNASVTGNPVVIGGLDQNGSVQGAKIVTVVSVAGGLAWLGITSVSGTVQAQVQSSIAAVIIGGSILTSSTANQSVSGTVGASIIGSVGVNQGAAASLVGGWPIINGEAADATGTFTNATQTTSVTNNNLDGYGNTLISINGTYGTATAVFEGSDDGGTTWYTVAAARDDSNVIETGYTSLTNVSRTWQINNSGFDSIRVRSTAVASGTANIRISSSAAPNSSGATVAIGAALPAGTNAIGAVFASITGTVITTFTNSSIIAIQSGSVISINQGSIASAQIGTAITSIVGSFLEDSASANADPGVFVLGVRNDTLSSVTSTDGDYTQHTVGPAGETIIANAPYTKWIQGNTSIFGATSVAVLAAQGASIFTYITGLQVTNASANNVYVTLGTGSNSILGYTVAPANGGSNIYFPNALKTTQNGTFTASINGVASIFLSAQGFISKT